MKSLQEVLKKNIYGIMNKKEVYDPPRDLSLRGS